MHNAVIKTIGGIKCELGEGLIWDPEPKLLLMTDITQKRLIAVDIEMNTHRLWTMPEPIGWVLPTEQKNTYALGLKSGIAVFDTVSQTEPAWLNREFPSNPQCRLNDACADSVGRIWYGSMNFCNEMREDGMLASLAVDESLVIHDKGFTVTNGPLISPDNRFLYFSDTLKRVVYRYDYSLASGDISNRTAFLTFDAEQGYPDGMCFDMDGNLWIAMWGAGCVLKFDLVGALLDKFVIPAPNVTNVCFGGANLDRLFVSSASIGIGGSEGQRFPLSGCVFELTDHGSRGLNSHPVKLGTQWNSYR